MLQLTYAHKHTHTVKSDLAAALVTGDRVWEHLINLKLGPKLMPAN